MNEWIICGGIFDLTTKISELQTIENKMEDPLFWQGGEAAQNDIEKVKKLRQWTIPAKEVESRLKDVEELLGSLSSEEKKAFAEDVSNELEEIEVLVEDLETRRMFSGEMDLENCFLSVNAGSGGTEACDWAEMLARMYQRYAQKKNWSCVILDLLAGEVAGYRNITLKISGEYVYGHLKAEKGVHRLVRISPFDSNARRHTSFASVEVVPEVTQEISVEVRTEDLRVDTFRASGAGGQHVNTTDSAVRITHLPSGIVVSCQSERSQIQNRETCMQMLRSRLYEKEMLNMREKLKGLEGEKMDMAGGSQIRNYVLTPYTLVKDTRTKYEEGDVDRVLNGDLDQFILSFLKEYSSHAS